MFYAEQRHENNPRKSYVVNPHNKFKKGHTMARHKKHKKDLKHHYSANPKRHPKRRPEESPKSAHHHAFTGSVARPKLRKTSEGHYARSAKSKKIYPEVHITNPRHYKKRKYSRNPIFGGYFGGVKSAAEAATWGLLGAFGVNLVTNYATEAAKITDKTTMDIVKAGVATVPVALKKWLGPKAELMTAGALLILGYNAVQNLLSQIGLPADIVTKLSDSNVKTVYVPVPTPSFKEIRPYNPPSAFNALAPANYQYTNKPVMN